jgi:hypothetical protein
MIPDCGREMEQVHGEFERMAGFNRLAIKMIGTKDEGAGAIREASGGARFEDGSVGAFVSSRAVSCPATLGTARLFSQAGAERSTQDVSGLSGWKREPLLS